MNSSLGSSPYSFSDLKLLMLFTYLVVAPFYLFPSGQPQLSDYLMTTLVALLFFDNKSKFNFHIEAMLASLIAFVYYISMLNAVWVGITGEVEFIKTSLFYIYNGFVFVVVLKMFVIYKEKLYSIILYGLVVSASIEVIILLFEYSSVYRSVGSFNNPNQLGYFAVVAVSIYSVITTDQKSNLWFDILMVLIFLFIVVLSLSKAALVAVLFNIMFVLFKDFRYAIALFGVFLAIYLLTDINHPIAHRLDSRIGTFGTQNDDNLIGRAYDRIWENPEYLILGAGEGLSKRFTEGGVEKEIHSSLGSILFSYGLIGFILFLFFIYLIYKYSTIKYFIFLLPSFVYGTTHQGLRFTFFWILLALLVTKGSEQAKRKNIKSSR